ncbi:hypothetical protein DL96DRAFT_1624059, partial [Flagelloscypha sp. PMI_526]
MSQVPIDEALNIPPESELLACTLDAPTQPPSYAQANRGPARRPKAGTYIFKNVSPTVTTIEPQSGGVPIYSILTEKLPISKTTLITIKKGGPDMGGKVVAAFELGGRDFILIDGKQYTRSKIFTTLKVPASKLAKQLWCEYGTYRGRWTRDPENLRKDCILCHLKPPPTGPQTSKPFARFWFSDKLRSLFEPQKYKAEPELEIFEEGRSETDAYIIAIVLLTVDQPEVMEKLL